MKRILKVFLLAIVILFITHFVVMFLFLRTPFLEIPEKLANDQVRLAVVEYDLKSENCNFFCFINESWKITLAYFKKGPGLYDYAKILNDKTKSPEIRADILSSVSSEMKNSQYDLRKDEDLYEAILKIAADQDENTEIRLRVFDILKLVKNNDPRVKEIAQEIINHEPDNPFSSVKAQATKLLVAESPNDIDTLFELLKNPDSIVSANASGALIRKYPRETYRRIEEIVEIAKNKNYKPVTRAGALSLISNLYKIFGNIDQNIINSLQFLLNDEHGGIRGLTAEILEKITGEKYEVEPSTEEEDEEILW